MSERAEKYRHYKEEARRFFYASHDVEFFDFRKFFALVSDALDATIQQWEANEYDPHDDSWSEAGCDNATCALCRCFDRDCESFISLYLDNECYIRRASISFSCPLAVVDHCDISDSGWQKALRGKKRKYLGSLRKAKKSWEDLREKMG